MRPDQEVLTAEMKINLVAPADGVRLVATGEVIKPGRRLVVTRAKVETEYADGRRKVVAILQGAPNATTADVRVEVMEEVYA